MKLLKILTSIFLLAGAALVSAFFLIPHERILEIALKRVEETTGRTIEVIGESQITIFPNLGVAAQGIRVREGRDQSPLGNLSAEALSVSVKTMELLLGKIAFNKVTLDGADILIIPKAPSDQTEAKQSDDASPERVRHADADYSEAMEQFGFEAVELKNSRVTIQAENGGKPHQFSDINAIIRPAHGPDGINVELQASYSKAPFEISLDITSLTEIFSKKGSVDATFKSDFAQIAAEATSPLSDDIGVELDLEVRDLAGLLSVAGMKDISVPPAIGNSMTLRADSRIVGQNIDAQKMTVAFAKNTITAQLKIQLADVPEITGSIDLGEFIYGDQPEVAKASPKSAEKNSSGWSNEPISIPALNFINTRLGIKAKSVVYESFQIDGLSADLALENGRLIADVKQMTLFNGAISGQVTANTVGGFKVSGDLNATDLSLGTTLKKLADLDKVQGTLDVKSSLSTSGNSVAALMQNLSGKGQFSLNQGRYTGIDLDKILRSGQINDGTTLIDTASGSYSIASGILSNNDFFLSIPDAETSGEGIINITGQSMDYVVTPKLLKARADRGLSIPVRLKGSWNQIKILPDLEAALQQNLDLELKAAEKELKERAKQKIEQKIGAPVDNLKETANDKLKQVEGEIKEKAKEELSKGLKNLLGAGK